MTIKNVNTTTSPRFEKEINGVLLSFSFQYTNDNPPINITVGANQNMGGGVNIMLNRTYNNTGEYTTYNTNGVDTNTIECAPFDKAFNDALKLFVLDIYKNYNNLTLL